MLSFPAFIPRVLLRQLHTSRRAGHVVLLLGARRVGKTALLRHCEEYYRSEGLRVLRLNGENVETQALFAHQSTHQYRHRFGGTDVLLLDEAQAVPSAAAHLKFLVDEVPTLSVIATGSAPIDIRDVGAPLVGRSTTLYLYPFSFGELAAFSHPAERGSTLEERLIYGCYPSVVLAETFQAKAAYLQEHIHTLLLRDILAFENIRQPAKLWDLLRLIALQLGQEVSLHELGTQLGMSKNTVERYLDLLEKVFVVVRRGGFASNMRNQIAKSSRWYFLDTGIRNGVLGDFRPLASRDGHELGRLWENYCIQERLKYNAYDAERRWIRSYFLRTYTQQEIDLIEVADGSSPDVPVLQAFECKWSARAKQRIPSAWREAYPHIPVQCIDRENYEKFF